MKFTHKVHAVKALRNMRRTLDVQIRVNDEGGYDVVLGHLSLIEERRLVEDIMGFGVSEYLREKESR